jgi:hypothetical protein
VKRYYSIDFRMGVCTLDDHKYFGFAAFFVTFLLSVIMLSFHPETRSGIPHFLDMTDFFFSVGNGIRICALLASVSGLICLVFKANCFKNIIFYIHFFCWIIILAMLVLFITSMDWNLNSYKSDSLLKGNQKKVFQ